MFRERIFIQTLKHFISSSMVFFTLGQTALKGMSTVRCVFVFFQGEGGAGSTRLASDETGSGVGVRVISQGHIL